MILFEEKFTFVSRDAAMRRADYTFNCQLNIDKEY